MPMTPAEMTLLELEEFLDLTRARRLATECPDSFKAQNEMVYELEAEISRRAEPYRMR